MDTEIETAFTRRSIKSDDATIWDKVAKATRTFDGSATDLAYEYEAFLLNRQSTGNTINDKLLESFQEHLARKAAKKATTSRATENLTFSGNAWDETADAFPDTVLPARKALQDTPSRLNQVSAGRGTPLARKPSDVLIATPAASAFKDRTQRGIVQVVLNETLSLNSQGQGMEVDGEARCLVEPAAELLPADQRYLLERLEHKAYYVESRITAFATALEEAEDCTADHPIYAASQEEVWCVGRVCSEGEGRLNAGSIFLEGSMQHSEGRRVPLDVSKLDAYRLFPGQVVGVLGTNPSGHRLIASRLVTSLPLPVPASTTDRLADFARATGRPGLSLVVAAGPFTCSDNLAYQPLQELLEHCRAAPPDCLLLLGPFLDAEHPMLTDQKLDVAFEDIYSTQVEQRLVEFCAAVPSTRVVVLPSTRDVHHHPVFPQPQLQGLPPAIMSLPNPATFNCNEVVIGCVTMDVVKQLAGQEAALGTGDRMSALASHIIAQRSYYPLYPAAPGSFLDTSLGQHLDLPVTPDILLLPSDLSPFAKLVPHGQHRASASSEGGGGGGPQVVCINPGRLAKGMAGGTYAQLQIGPSREGMAVAEGQPSATNGLIGHAVDQRCKVEVKRI